MVVQERIAPNSQVQEALADPLEVVQAMTQAGPYAFHRVAVYTGTVRVTTSGLACAMVHRPMVIVSLGAMVEVICIGEERRPGFSRGGHDGCDRRGAYVLEHCERDVRGWRVLVCLGAALHQARMGGRSVSVRVRVSAEISNSRPSGVVLNIRIFPFWSMNSLSEPSSGM